MNPSHSSPHADGDVREVSGYLRLPEGPALYVHAYEPADERVRRSPVILVPPDGDERMWSSTVLANLGRFLARHGYAVARFDYRGQGESEGEYEATDIGTRLGDLAAAVALARTTWRSAPALVGFRLGANIAVHAAAADRAAFGSILAVAPLPAPATLVDDMLRKNIVNQYAVHKKVQDSRAALEEQIMAGGLVSCNGYRLGRPFAQSLRSLDWAAGKAAADGIHVLQIGGPEKEGVQRLDGIQPFWKETPRYSCAPQALFRAIADRLPRRSGAFRGAALKLDERGGQGQTIVRMPLSPAVQECTFHAADGQGAGVVFVNPGPNDRAGPHGLYVRLAQALVRQGSPVLRFDGVGVVDSGPCDRLTHDESLEAAYRTINTGLFVDGALAAVDWLAARTRRPVILAGLCGGANTALLAAGKTPGKIARVVLLGATVLHQGRGVDQVLADGMVKEEIRIMRRKLLSPRHLLRLVTFQSDYGLIWRIGVERLAHVRELFAGKTGPELHPETNHELLDAWRRYISAGGRVTLVYSEFDQYYHLYRQFFGPFAAGESLPKNAEEVLLLGSNHTITDDAGERELTDLFLRLAASGASA